jgi:integrase
VPRATRGNPAVRPGAAGPRGGNAFARAPRGCRDAAPPTIAFVASYADWMAAKVSWSPKTRRPGEAVLSRFCTLVDERAVETITQAVAERFRDRLRRVPRLNGKGFYAGLTLREAVAAADEIEAGLKAGDGPVHHDGKLIPRDRAEKLALRISLKTINRDMTFLVDWGGWMAHSDERRDLLARGRNPFAGMLIEKRTVARDSAASGRKRRPFTSEEVARLVANLPIPGAADDDDECPGARRWAVLIAMYSGMRLGEIVQLRVADVRREAGVDLFDLSEEGGRKLKTEAGARQIRIHPALVEAGIFELVSARCAAGAVDLLPRAASDVGHQRPTNALSKWFGRFRHGLGITSPAKTFHATRHTELLPVWWTPR